MPDPRRTDEGYLIDLRRFYLGIVVVAAAAVLGWATLFAKTDPAVLNPAGFAGCYRAGETVVRLSDRGVFHTAAGDWPFQITQGKKGKEISVLNIAVDGASERPVFRRGGHGFISDIVQGREFRLYAGETLVTFAKVPCETAPRAA